MSVYNSNEEAEKIEDAEIEEELDPRIQHELERLNKSCADINNLENELDEAKTRFIFLKNKQLERLQFWQKKLGNNITKSRPYYEALKLSEALQIETQNAVHEFQKTNSLYKTAKETLSVAESSLTAQGEIPDEWQEHLSLTITKISLSKEAASRAEKHHRAVAEQCLQAEKRSQNLEKELKKYIEKSKLYYDEKGQWNIQIEAQKAHIHNLEQTLISTKKAYKEAMNNLSQISEEIHNRRKLDKMLKTEARNIADAQLSEKNPDADSISNESHTSETESKKVSNFLGLYNLSLPHKENGPDTSAARTYNELKDCEASEYISLGLNSTPSNSRSSSPSNSLDTDINDWSKSLNGHGSNSQTVRMNYLKNTTSEISSNTTYSSLDDSAMSRIDPVNSYKEKYLTTTTTTLASNLGMSSLTLKSPDPVKKLPNDFNKADISLTPTFKSNGASMLSNHRLTSKPNKSQTKNETPLLSNLLLQHSARF